MTDKKNKDKKPTKGFDPTRKPAGEQKRNPFLEGRYDHKKKYAEAMSKKSDYSNLKTMEPPKSNSGIGESSTKLKAKSHAEVIKGAQEYLKGANDNTGAPKISIGEAILNKLRSQGVSEEEIQKRLKNLK